MSIIDISHVTKTFDKKTALDDVSLTIDAGEIFGFLGPNGAGKSTTIRCVMGFIFPDSGKMSVKGLPVDRSHAQYREKLDTFRRTFNSMLTGQANSIFHFCRMFEKLA